MVKKNIKTIINFFLRGKYLSIINPTDYPPITPEIAVINPVIPIYVSL